MRTIDNFTEEEQITILELARVAMSDAETFDTLANQLDISDSTMIELREKINKIMS